MEYLLLIVESLKPIQAARLAIWREQSSLVPDNLAKEWRDKVKTEPYTNEIPSETMISDVNAIKILDTCMSKKNSFILGGVEKALAKLSETLNKLKARAEKPG